MTETKFPLITYQPKRDKLHMIDCFKDFELPVDCTGGCIKTPIRHSCARIRQDSSIGKITVNCEHWAACPGHKFDFKV